MQLTDARGFRSGAAISVLLLVGAAAAGGSPPLVAALAVAMLLSAATRLRLSLLALPFRLLRARGLIDAPTPAQLQPVPGLRLAQLLGGALLLVALLFGSLDATLVSLFLVSTVATLQAFLAITGICVACKLYGLVRWLDQRTTLPPRPPFEPR